MGAGLKVMRALMDESVTALCGPKGKHQAERAAVRHGSEHGSVTLGGGRVPAPRPERGWQRRGDGPGV